MKKDTIIHGSRLQEVIKEQVEEALIQQEVSTSELAEFYLVNLIHDYHSTSQIVRREGEDALERPLALLLVEAVSGDTPTRVRLFKRIGDHALVIAGFFAESIRKTLVDASYYAAMGGAAYKNLAVTLCAHKTFSDLYTELSDKFSEFADALSIVAPWNRPESDIGLIRIYERWLATGDDKLRVILNEKGIYTSTDAKGGLSQ